MFNFDRFCLLVEDYLKTGQVSSVDVINKKENVWFFQSHQLSSIIKLGGSIEDHGADLNRTIETFQKQFNNEHFIYIYHKKKFQICVHFLEKADQTKDKMKAIYHALVIYFIYFNYKMCSILSKTGFNYESLIPDDQDKLIQETNLFVNNTFPSFIKAIKSKGWNVDKILLLEEGWRCSLD